MQLLLAKLPSLRQLATRGFRLAVYLLFCLGMSLGATSCFDSCQPPFPPSNQIDKFRILAIQAEPPEVTPGDPVSVKFLAVSTNGLISPSTFGSLSSCFVDGGSSDPSAFWIGCLPGVGVQQASDNFCANIPTLSFGSNDGGNPADAGFALDGGLPKEFQLFLPPCGAQSTWFSPADYLDPLPPDQQKTGAEAIVVLATSFQKQQQITLKRIRLSNRPKSEQNTNPVLLGMKINNDPVQTCRPENPDTCKLYTVPAQKEAEIQVVLDLSRQDRLPNQPNQPERNEDITIEWFATQGSFDLRHTVRSGETPPKDSPWPKWKPSDFKGNPLPPGQEVQIVAIARDSRGGTDWISLRLSLGPPEPSKD